ncbi:MAG: hypothetical protein AAGF11_27880 [Myxococcota bacterium]
MPLVLGSVACQSDDNRVTTLIDDRAIVTFDRSLCKGDVTLIEQTIERVEERLDVRAPSPIELSIWSRYAEVSAHCSEGALGCYNDGEAHALWQAQEHEIVHAVAAPLGTPEPLWNEGIAEALSSRTQEGQEDVVSLVGLEDSPQVDYSTAGHFVRWLLEEYGQEGVRALARGSSFEHAYGMELADASVDHKASAPWSYPHWTPCRGERLEATSENGWAHELHVNCDDPWSSAEYQSGPTVFRTTDIEEPGTYRALFTGATLVGAVACQLDPLLDRPAQDTAGDIIRETTRSSVPTFLSSDEPHEIQLEPGRILWSITVEGEASTVGFDLNRIGP